MNGYATTGAQAQRLTDRRSCISRRGQPSVSNPSVYSATRRLSPTSTGVVPTSSPSTKTRAFGGSDVMVTRSIGMGLKSVAHPPDAAPVTARTTATSADPRLILPDTLHPRFLTDRRAALQRAARASRSSPRANARAARYPPRAARGAPADSCGPRTVPTAIWAVHERAARHRDRQPNRRPASGAEPAHRHGRSPRLVAPIHARPQPRTSAPPTTSRPARRLRWSGLCAHSSTGWYCRRIRRAMAPCTRYHVDCRHAGRPGGRPRAAPGPPRTPSGRRAPA